MYRRIPVARALVTWLGITLCLLVLLVSTAVAAPITLKFWKFSAINDDPDLEKMVEEWNKTHPNVQVRFETFPWEQYLGEKLTVGFATGEGPDVFWISPGEFMKYVNAGIALALDPYVPDSLKRDLVPAALDAVTVRGQIYAIPHEMEPVALYYDEVLFKQLGLKVPETWDEIVTVAKKIRTPQRWGIMIPTAADYYQNFIFYPFLWMAGGEVVDKDQTKAVFDSEASSKALDFWGDLVNRHQVAPPTGGGPGDESLPNGLTGMFVVGYWYVGILKNAHPDFRYGVAPIPPPARGGRRVSVYGGWMTMVNGRSKYAKEAAEFAVWLFGQDVTRPLTWIKFPRAKLSPRRSVMAAAADYFKQFPHNVFAEQIFGIARAEPAYPPEIAQAVTDAIQAVMFGGKTGQQAARDAQRRIEQYLAGQRR